MIHYPGWDGLDWLVVFVAVCVNKASVAPPFVCADCDHGISESVPVTQMDKCMHISSVAHKFAD